MHLKRILFFFVSIQKKIQKSPVDVFNNAQQILLYSNVNAFSIFRENSTLHHQVEQMLQKISPLQKCQEELGSLKAELEEKKVPAVISHSFILSTWGPLVHVIGGRAHAVSQQRKQMPVQTLQVYYCTQRRQNWLIHGLVLTAMISSVIPCQLLMLHERFSRVTSQL